MNAASETTGFFKALFELVESIRTDKKSSITSLQAFADKKFLEIDTTNRLFVQSLTNLHSAVDRARYTVSRSDDVSQIISDLHQSIRVIDDAREAGRLTRISQYQEAQVYSERLIGDTGVFVTLPQTVTLALKHFMVEWSKYFQTGDRYNHELSRCLGYATYVVRLITLTLLDTENVSRTDKIRQYFADLDQTISEALELSRARWSRVSRAYHELKLSLREFGAPIS